MEIFAERLRLLRVKAGLSEAQLAKELGFSASDIKNYEACKSVPKIRRVIIIADFFNVTTDYLVNTKKYQQTLKKIFRE
ncbi:MAG: helix-turn-helix domain-containing protein [Firmicutes bacterium]|nr:helix-turn-helix domain-containing protein [Bacillota bacterium]